MYAYIWACMNSFDPVKIGENPKLFQNWLIGKHQRHQILKILINNWYGIFNFLSLSVADSAVVYMLNMFTECLICFFRLSYHFGTCNVPTIFTY